MEIKYKKLIFNPNAYFDIKRKEVILPISPEWKNVVKWQKEFPNKIYNLEYESLVEDPKKNIGKKKIFNKDKGWY